MYMALFEPLWFCRDQKTDLGLTCMVVVSYLSTRSPWRLKPVCDAVFVQFDVWGISRLMADSLAEGWKVAKSYEGNPRLGFTNGHEKVVVNGKEEEKK